jgi:tetratricopeptide (TPR) repeat protein
VLTAMMGGALVAGVLSRPPGPFDKAIALMDKGEEGVAATEFVDIGNASRDGRAYAYAAYCFAKKKDYQKALWGSGEAIACGRADDAVVKANRAFAHFQMNHLTEALSDSNEAVAADPSCMEARLLRAQVAVRLDELHKDRTLFPQAIDDLERVRTGRPRAAEASRLAAKIYAKTGERDKAAGAVWEAVARGWDPGAAARDPVFTPLKDHPVFKKAVENPPADRPQPSALLPLRPRY